MLTFETKMSDAEIKFVKFFLINKLLNTINVFWTFLKVSEKTRSKSIKNLSWNTGKNEKRAHKNFEIFHNI